MQPNEVSEWHNIKIGTWADTILDFHPSDEWISQPTIYRDESSRDLIVIWLYPEVDLVLERSHIWDPIMRRMLRENAVQKILYIGDVHRNADRLRKRKKRKRRKKNPRRKR